MSTYTFYKDHYDDCLFRKNEDTYQTAVWWPDSKEWHPCPMDPATVVPITVEQAEKIAGVSLRVSEPQPAA